jgi:hypothetical protein
MRGAFTTWTETCLIIDTTAAAATSTTTTTTTTNNNNNNNNNNTDTDIVHVTSQACKVTDASGKLCCNLNDVNLCCFLVSIFVCIIVVCGQYIE